MLKISNNINAIHTYLVYPRGGFLKQDAPEAEDVSEDTGEGPESVEASSDYMGPMYMVGNKVKNINRACYHFGSEGIVTEIKELPDRMGKVISYQVTNEGETYKKGDVLTKTPDQLTKIN